MRTADDILGSCNEIFKLSPNNVKSIGDDIPIPSIDKMTLATLLKLVPEHFQKYPTVLNLDGDFVIVGDIHGNLHDLVRIFSHYGLPPNRSYIFLGDYVDRGEYSVEVVLILFALMLQYPSHVFLLRGNHEFSRVNHHYGLYDEIKMKYNDEELFILFNDAFAFMPIAAVLNNYYFLIHAGIDSESRSKIDEIRNIERPIYDYEGSLLVNLLWSDPTDDQELSGTQNLRGIGCYYGENDVNLFLKDAGLHMLIRGHQCVFGTHLVHNGLTMTLFSSSGYSENNTGAAIEILGNELSSTYSYDPIKYMHARDAFYYSIKSVPRNHIKAFQQSSLPRLGRSFSTTTRINSSIRHSSVGKSVSYIFL